MMLATLLDLAGALGLSLAAAMTVMFVGDAVSWAFGVILDPDEDEEIDDGTGPWGVP